jgi:hypothetical protein
MQALPKKRPFVEGAGLESTIDDFKQSYRGRNFKLLSPYFKLKVVAVFQRLELEDGFSPSISDLDLAERGAL